MVYPLITAFFIMLLSTSLDAQEGQNITYPTEIPTDIATDATAHITTEGVNQPGQAASTNPSQSLSGAATQLSTATPPQPSGVGITNECPQQCTCDKVRHSVSCNHKGLTNVPTGIPRYTWYLSLNGNQFPNLPRYAFADLPNLVSLQLVQCGISSIHPHAFEGLRQLRHLDLRSNLLQNITNETFSGIAVLTDLELQYNEIEEIAHSAFHELILLNKLSLDGNPISHFESNLFGNNQYLEVLSLRYCKFTDVNLIATAGSTKLKHLDLSGNSITKLDADSFERLPSLTSLYLANMFPKLEVIDDDAFKGLVNLKDLDISDNYLQGFGPSHVMPLTSLESLSLKNNPWNCNCQMGRLVAWLHRTTIDYYDTLWRCQSPLDLEGQIVFVIHPLEKFACAPYVFKPPRNATIEFGDSAVFRISVDGDPTPVVEWYLPNGNLILSRDQGQHEYVEAGSGVMIIQQASEYHNGTFSVTAMNEHGNVTVIFEVTVLGMPIWKESTTMTQRAETEMTTEQNVLVTTIPPSCIYAPIQVRVTDITDTSATLSWTPYDSDDLVGYIIHQTEFGSPDSYRTTLTNPARTSQKITSLKANSNFILCATAYLSLCPSFASLDQCIQISTKGDLGPNGANSLEVVHRNELIILAIASIAATLLLMGTIFLICWKFKQPKSLRRYEFHTNDDTIRFAGLDPVDMTAMHRSSDTSQPRNGSVFVAYDHPPTSVPVNNSDEGEPEYESPREYPLTTFHVEVHKEPLPPDETNVPGGQLSHGVINTSFDGNALNGDTLGYTLTDDAGMATLLSELRFQQAEADSDSDDYNYLS